MFVNKLLIIIAIEAIFAISSGSAQIQPTNNLKVGKLSTEKELYIPPKVYRIPDNNDYSNSENDYSFKRMVEGENIAILWHKEFGNDPSSNPNERKRFNPREALKELERFYNFYVNDLKLVQKGNSL